MKPIPQRHLFLDSSFLHDAEGVRLEVRPPERRERVIEPDCPWESLMISFFLTVREEAGMLRLWYICRDAEDRPNLAYAESRDGVHWVKPELGIAGHGGSTRNNLLGVPGVEGVVMLDPKAASPEERYLYVTRLKKQGVYRYVSADGLVWKRDKEPLLGFTSDTQNVVFRDEATGVFALYLRGWKSGSDSRWRTVVHCTAEDLSRPLPVVPGEGGGVVYRPDAPPLISGELPVVLAADERDPADADVYNISAQPYPLDPRWVVGFPSWMRRGRSLSDGRLEVQFVGSRDGVRWERYDRAPYVAPGREGSDCANMVFMGTGLIIRGDEIWQYGTGFSSRHGDKGARRQKSDGVIYRYVQRVDGFVSLTFGNEPGRCATGPVTVEGGQLCVNVDTGALGALRIALVGPDDCELPGFGLGDCDSIEANETRKVISWRGQSDLSALVGATVRLRLAGSRARLYSFYFEAVETR